MARLPSCVVCEGYVMEHGRLCALLRLRKWHPGYWLSVLRAVWGIMTGKMADDEVPF